MVEERDELAPDVHESRRRALSEIHLNFPTRVDRPKAIILAGQPGAGKTKMRKEAVESFDAKEGFVAIDTDELRASHPRYKTFAKENDRTAAARVQKDASQWSDELIQDTIDARCNLLVDGTLKTPDNARSLCTQLKENGYEVEIRALAVPIEDSEMRIYSRYERQREELGTGRWVPKGIQHEAYPGMVESLRVVEDEGLAGTMKVYRDSPSFEQIYENKNASLGGMDAASKTVEQERARKRSVKELEGRLADSSDIIKRMEKRNADFNRPENARAKELHDKNEQALEQRLTPAARMRLERDSRSTKPEKGPHKK